VWSVQEGWPNRLVRAVQPPGLVNLKFRGKSFIWSSHLFTPSRKHLRVPSMTTPPHSQAVPLTYLLPAGRCPFLRIFVRLVGVGAAYVTRVQVWVSDTICIRYVDTHFLKRKPTKMVYSSTHICVSHKYRIRIHHPLGVSV
jgi:hypothetical protein